jgi:hypothetical protein
MISAVGIREKPKYFIVCGARIQKDFIALLS